MQRQTNIHPCIGGIGGSVINVAVAPESVDLLGKHASDLMDGVTINNDTISGMLKYMTDYTGFSSNVDEQEGNYIALLFTADGVSINVKHSGGKNPDTPIQLDGDGIYILRVSATDQTITAMVTKDGKQQSRTLKLAVTLEGGD